MNVASIVLMGIMCVNLADAAGMEDENAATEELLLWIALLVAVVAAWEAIKWAGRKVAGFVRGLEDWGSTSTTGD